MQDLNSQPSTASLVNIAINMIFIMFQLAHPILESLKGTDKEWLVNLMYAFNSGNISKFDDLKKSWSTQVRKHFIGASSWEYLVLLNLH